MINYITNEFAHEKFGKICHITIEVTENDKIKRHAIINKPEKEAKQLAKNKTKLIIRDILRRYANHREQSLTHGSMFNVSDKKAVAKIREIIKHSQGKNLQFLINEIITNEGDLLYLLPSPSSRIQAWRKTIPELLKWCKTK